MNSLVSGLIAVLRGHVVLLAGATFVGTIAGLAAGDLTGIPAKIEVAEASVSGGQGQIKVSLVDPANSPAPAKKDLQLEIQTKSESGDIGKSIVTIKQGQTEALGTLPTKSAGIVEVTAIHPELAKGGTIIDVPKSGETTTPSPTAAPITTVAPMVTVTPAEASSGAAASPAFPDRLRAWRRETRNLTTRAAGSRAPASVASTEIAPEAAGVGGTPSGSRTGPPPTLKLRYYPARKLRADERDPATVCAILPSDEPAWTDFSVFLMSDVGPLTPEPIKIPAGKVRGEGKLVATRPGTVQVWYEYSTPPATAPADTLKIDFTHPVWAPKLVPTSQTVTLFDSVDVAVELVNYEGTSVPADDERKVDIRIASGLGQLSATEVKFAPNDNRQITKFTPIKPGKVQLIANTTYLPELPPAELSVVTPYGLLALCGLGSVLGALLVYLTDKQSATWKRLVVGFITGYVLYWALLFGVVFIPNFPHVFLLNPFTAVILPLFGGWLGTKVITGILGNFGWQF
jgi:hypothetical protein